jgi:hypothetical protein
MVEERSSRAKNSRAKKREEINSTQIYCTFYRGIKATSKKDNHIKDR